jgi:hypothetical protein
MKLSETSAFWWLDLALITGFVTECIVRRKEPWTRPAGAVYLTIAFWYLGDWVYSQPEEFWVFSTGLIDRALIEVGGFVVAFRLIIALLYARSPWFWEASSDVEPFTPVATAMFFRALSVPWAALFGIGLFNAQFNILGILWPPSSPVPVTLYTQAALGGSFSFLSATAGYIYVALCALFGVGFALSDGAIRKWFLAMIFITWPYFLFDRTRHVMLTLLMPSLFAYLLLRQGRWIRKAIVIAVLGLAVNTWFLFVLNARNSERGVAGTFEDFLTKLSGAEVLGTKNEEENKRHEGLDMLKELCYVNGYLASGEYEVNWGKRYFAELVNFVPRAVWPNKPMIGIDYAIVRGMEAGTTDDQSLSLGVHATVSTGAIGQGLVNFGPVLGVLSTALLMSFWTGVLAKLWTQRYSILRAALFLVGLGLTFNLGRDITLLVLWPFVFAYIGARVIEKFYPELSLQVARAEHIDVEAAGELESR